MRTAKCAACGATLWTDTGFDSHEAAMRRANSTLTVLPADAPFHVCVPKAPAPAPAPAPSVTA